MKKIKEQRDKKEEVFKTSKIKCSNKIMEKKKAEKNDNTAVFYEFKQKNNESEKIKMWKIRMIFVHTFSIF